MSTDTKKETVITGDRPTGPLHLGHHAGSLQTRIALQQRHEQTVLIADVQALTDHAERGPEVTENVFELMLDYLAVGIDPGKATFVLQSAVPELSELTMLYLNLVTVARLERNPTVRNEIQLKGFARDIPAGFLCYPVSQAADITGLAGTLVPVGGDQLPMLEQTNEIVRRVNHLAGGPVLPEAKSQLSNTPRLPGVDGKGKASKSLKNAIFLSDSADVIADRVQSMFTDPAHVRASDPGRIEGNVVFAYLDAFDPDKAAVEELKLRYLAGGLGDMVLKRRLKQILQDFLEPIRNRRLQLAKDRSYLVELLRQGTATARNTAAEVCGRVKRAVAPSALILHGETPAIPRHPRL